MLANKSRGFRLITYIFLFIVLTGSLSTYESDSKVYIAVVAYMLLFFLYVLFWKKIDIVRYPIIVSVIMLTVWIYGLFWGLFNENNTASVLRNFAGMSVYILVFPLFNAGINNKKYMKFIMAISEYALYISIFTYIMLTYFNFRILFKIPILNAFVGGGGIGGFVQYFCRELILVAFAYYFYILLNKNTNILKSIIIIMLAVYETLIVNDSGGDALAMAVLAVVIVLSQARCMKPRTVILCLLAIVGMVGVYFYLGEGFLSRLFSMEDGGNIRRWEEINYFKKTITFWGYGLGKELGYAGSGKYNYGTEMIYLNIFHKFGIFAVMILACYLSTCVKAIRYLANNEERNPEKVIPIALMAYLIPSLANPMLFSVLAVVSHLLAMIIISREDEKIQIERAI